ncbi:uridylate-specific endoribonuclease A [Tachysurus vachellii]|uniref:uridylate-specific endoribonuclease A n=1 Tax=Tachysurus vachellii TaxID=175792 RepID=UPI00296B51CD|nr:uridylate-specific endoribonuclease A [Tachysurus vachellii]
MRNFLLLLLTFDLIGLGHGNCSEKNSRTSDSEIVNVSEVLYSLDLNKASTSQLIINPQTLINQSDTNKKNDLSPLPLFVNVDEASLLSKPTYAALIALLDNYEKKTGVSESYSGLEVQEQENFLKETMKNTELGRELFAFFYTKGYYRSWEEFLYDLKMMWFGLYSRSSGSLDSSGFEHIFAGEIKKGKVSGFHNWVRFYLLEKSGLLNYYSYSYDGPWTSYPDVLGMQFMWDGYYKQIGSALIGSSPELDVALYTLCYVTRPGKQCRLSLGGKQLTVQTYTWDKTTYGDGKKFIASAYPVTP